MAAGQTGVAAIEIAALPDLPHAFGAMRAEAAAEGHHFLERLAAEWHTGANRFDREGEVLLGATLGHDLAAVAGLNRDPYTERARTGRLRHLYVMQAFRRRGVASALLRELLAHAEGRFDVVRVRTTAQATRFYQAQGFTGVRDDTATHILALPRR